MRATKSVPTSEPSKNSQEISGSAIQQEQMTNVSKAESKEEKLSKKISRILKNKSLSNNQKAVLISKTVSDHNSLASPIKDRLSRVTNIIKLVSKSKGIKLSSSNHLALGRSTRIISKFFSKYCRDGIETKCRRFLLRGNGEIAYQSDSRPFRMKLEKLIVSLVFNSDKLFSYLKAVSNKKSGVNAYTVDEKKFIREFVRASNYNFRHINCVKIRKLCK